MGIADSMKGITENIIASYDVRVKALGDLGADTRKTLKGFAEERKKMSEEQAKNLADFMDGLSKSVEDMLKGFQREHKNMSDGQAKSLADFVKNLNKDVGSMLKGFQTDRGKMSKELKKDLDKYVADIVSGVKKLLGEYSSDMKKAREAWKGLAATMEKKRGVKPLVEAEVKVRPVEEVIEEVEEEEVTPEMDMEEKVLKFINKHPKGVRVSDMEEPLGVARTRLGVIAKKLLDENKVRKEENMYFPL